MPLKKAIAAVFVCSAAIGIGSIPAGAHFVDVTPAGGGAGTCQFLGGTGNPGHAGHANGHSVALLAEQSGAIDIGGCD